MEVKQREITGVRKEGKGATERGTSTISHFPPASLWHDCLYAEEQRGA